jgi:hypothetical protein
MTSCTSRDTHTHTRAKHVGSLRTKILNARDIKSELVHVDEWDVDLTVRGLTGAERADIIAKATVKETDEKGVVTNTSVDQLVLLPLLIIASTTDPADGTAIFGDGDRDALNGKASSAIDAVSTVCLRLSGMTKDPSAMAKNSVATASADTASA